MRKALFFLFLLVSSSCFAQIPSEKIDSNTFFAKIGYIKTIFDTSYTSFDKYFADAPLQELVEMTNHQNPYARCNAFNALVTRKYSPDSILKILISHLADTNETVIIQSEEHITVADYFIGCCSPNYRSPILPGGNLYRKQRIIIDSILLMTQNNYRAANWAYRNLSLTPNNYPIIKHMVQYNLDNTAIVRLASYKNPDDIDLIINYRCIGKECMPFEDNFYAISQFPHPAFMPFLEDHLNDAIAKKEQWNAKEALFKAIASYKTIRSAQLLQLAFDSLQDEKNRFNILNSIDGNLDSVYHNLCWELLENGFFTNRIIQTLNLLDSDRTLNLFVKYFNNCQRPKLGQTVYVINYVFKKNQDAGRKILINFISCQAKNDDNLFFEKMRRNLDPVYIKPLLNQLKVENDERRFVDIVEILVLYQEPKVNRKLKKIVENYKLSTGFYTEQLQRILQKNNID